MRDLAAQLAAAEQKGAERMREIAERWLAPALDYGSLPYSVRVAMQRCLTEMRRKKE